MAATKTAKGKPRHAQAAQVAKLNRSTVLVVLVGLAAAGALFKFVYTAQAGVRDEARGALTAVEGEVARAEEDLAAVRAGRPDSLRALHERVSALDRTVPTEIDGLELAVWLESTIPAGLSDLVVPDPGAAVEVDGIPGMAKVVLPVTAEGPRASLLGWVQQLQAAPNRLITLEQATITSGEDGTSSLQMTLAVWQATGNLLVPAQVQSGTPTTTPPSPPEPADPADPVDPAEPVDPVDPVDPAEPVAPVDPADSVGLVDPAEPGPTSDPGDPGETPPAP